MKFRYKVLHTKYTKQNEIGIISYVNIGIQNQK